MPRSRLFPAVSSAKSAEQEPGPWSYSVFPTPLGWIATLGSRGTLVSLTLGHSSKESATEALLERFSEIAESQGVDEPLAENDWQPELRRRLIRYAEGEPVEFREVAVALGGRTTFQRRILEATRRIPYGATQTYGRLAEAAGAPGAARAVGSVMKSNRIPLVIPCHRVVASGSLGGYSAPQGIELKRTLLELESASSPARMKLQPARRKRAEFSST